MKAVSKHPGTWLPYLVLATAFPALVGCAPMALTVFGVGTATGVSHTLNGIAYRTFTLPANNVRSGVIAAMTRMSFKVKSSKKEGTTETLFATAKDRDITIELESLSGMSTRMRSVVKEGMFYDSATAMEIILQTERVLGAS